MTTDTQVFDPDGDVIFLMYRAGDTPSEGGANGTSLEEASGSDNQAQAKNMDAMDTDSDVTEQNSEAGVNIPDDPIPNFRVQVSSKHLSLASRVFKAMLNGRFQEGETLHSTGSVEIPLLHDDPHAFGILMDIIHGMHRKAPRTVEFEMLKKLTVLIDKYDLHECTGVYVDLWISSSISTAKVPSYLNEDLLCWLGIFWVFQKPTEFQSTMKFIERDNNGANLRDLRKTIEIPLPEHVLDEIETQRQNDISQALDTLDRYISLLTEPGSGKHFLYACNPEERFMCEATLLGTLLKSASEIGLFPRPQYPFEGFCFIQLMGKIKLLDLRATCRNHTVPLKRTRTHHMKERLLADIEKIKLNSVGFTLAQAAQKL